MYSESLKVGASFREKQQDELKRLVLERRKDVRRLLIQPIITI